MSAYDDDISRWLLDLAQPRMRGLEGVSIDNADRIGPVIEFHGTGWSPTLHHAALRWQVDVTTLGPEGPGFSLGRYCDFQRTLFLLPASNPTRSTGQPRMSSG